MTDAGPGPSGRDGPHAFVDDLHRPALEDGDRHHLARVVRLRPGDPLTVCDGAGRWRPCRFGPELDPTGEIAAVPRPVPAITVAFALVKGDRPEQITAKLTELGIDVIRPFAAARSVVRWEHARAVPATERLRRVAREAAMQCRRCWLPEVHPPGTFAAVAALPGAVRAERGGPPVTLLRPTVLVGPEGGWSPEEAAADLPVAGLGTHVLRAETAAICAAALLSAARAGLAPTSPEGPSGTLGG